MGWRWKVQPVRVGKRTLSWKEFEEDVSMFSGKVCIHQQITNLHMEIGAVIWGLWILPSELGHSFIIFLKGQVQPLSHTFIHLFHKYIFSNLYESGPILGTEDKAVNKTANELAFPPPKGTCIWLWAQAINKWF